MGMSDNYYDTPYAAFYVDEFLDEKDCETIYEVGRRLEIDDEDSYHLWTAFSKDIGMEIAPCDDETWKKFEKWDAEKRAEFDARARLLYAEASLLYSADACLSAAS